VGDALPVVAAAGRREPVRVELERPWPCERAARCTSSQDRVR